MARPDDLPRGDRIAKLLARAGIASRREVERMIAEGRIARDGVAIDTPATVLASLAGVTVDGNAVAAPAPARLFLYHKPPGLLVTERDPRGRPTIYDRLPADLPRLVPVGRLDLATEGLLLLTTDGGLKRQLELPATGVERTYRARAYGPVSQAGLEALIEGIEIDGFRYGPIDANLERRTGANSWIELRLAEGKNREVRRVLEHLGLEVSRLIRTAYGPFVLGDLPPGAMGEVRERDLAAFRATLGKKGAGGALAAITPLIVSGGGGRPVRSAAGDRERRPSPRPPPAGGRESKVTAPSGKRLPSAGRGPVAVRSGAKLNVSASRAGPPANLPRNGRQSAAAHLSQLGPGLRRGGGKEVRGASPLTPDQQAEEAPTRPAKIQRKPGWAKPKPKAGPRGPKKR